MVTPELKWPTTNFTPSADELVSDRDALLGIADDRRRRSWIFWPWMPPGALMSATACSTPFFNCAPKAALTAGERSGNAELDLGGGRTGAGQRYGEAERQAERSDPFHSKTLPLVEDLAWRSAGPLRRPPRGRSNGKAGEASAGFRRCGVWRAAFFAPS